MKNNINMPWYSIFIFFFLITFIFFNCFSSFDSFWPVIYSFWPVIYSFLTGHFIPFDRSFYSFFHIIVHFIFFTSGIIFSAAFLLGLWFILASYKLSFQPVRIHLKIHSCLCKKQYKNALSLIFLFLMTLSFYWFSSFYSFSITLLTPFFTSGIIFFRRISIPWACDLLKKKKQYKCLEFNFFFFFPMTFIFCIVQFILFLFHPSVTSFSLPGLFFRRIFLQGWVVNFNQIFFWLESRSGAGGSFLVSFFLCVSERYFDVLQVHLGSFFIMS